MAPGVRRRVRVNQVLDSESDDEGDHVMDASGTSASEIAISNHVNNGASPQRVPPAHDGSEARQSVEQLLQSRGLRPRAEWLESCLKELSTLQPGFARMPVARQAQLCFEQILMADFNVMGAASLPPAVLTLHDTELPGPFVLQVDEVTDISTSLRDRYRESPAGLRRTLKLSLTDGAQHVSGVEYRPIRALQVLSPAGMKISLKNICIRHGLLMLVPEVLDILGGLVEDLESARLRAVELMNKPPRGRRTRQGILEQSLVDRATRVAWPDNSSEGPVPPSENSGRPDQQTFHAACSHAPGTRPPDTVPMTSLNQSTWAAAACQGEMPQAMQEDQPAASGQLAQVSHVQWSERMASVHHQEQYQPLHQRTSSRLSRGSDERSVRLGTAQRSEDHQFMQQDHVSDMGRDPSRFPGVNPVRLEEIQELQTPQQVQIAGSTRQSVSRAVAESTSTQVSAESNGQRTSTPTFGRLSLQSRRLTQSKIFSPVVQKPQAYERHLQSAGAEHDMPITLDDSQESEQHRPARSCSPPSNINIFGGSVPFTYLAVLQEKTNSQIGRRGVVRGIVKCVVSGVVSFQYKEVDEFKLHIHIEDGSLIATADIRHQLVQRMVGCSPREVVSGLEHSDTRQKMLDNMNRFQKLLERFEGFMDLEFAGSSSVPTILQMTEGVQSFDVKLLLDRVADLMNKRTLDKDELIDLSTP